MGDIWVNSENTDMQMDRFYGKSTSATIRYLGAKRDSTTGRIVQDTIGDELARKLGRDRQGYPATVIQVDPATVIPTRAGALEESNNVKWIFHVAAVVGEPREGYRPIQGIGERCAAWREGRLLSFIATTLRRLFPYSEPPRHEMKDHAERCIDAAIDYLESNPTSPIQ